MQITKQDEPSATIIRVTGRLDSATASDFETQCGDTLDNAPVKTIIDFSDLEYISSAGLRTLLSLAKKAKSNNRILMLCSLSGLVQEVISVSGFDQILPIVDTLETALSE